MAARQKQLRIRNHTMVGRWAVAIYFISYGTYESTTEIGGPAAMDGELRSLPLLPLGSRSRRRATGTGESIQFGFSNGSLDPDLILHGPHLPHRPMLININLLAMELNSTTSFRRAARLL
jgi:hypothetical protein